MEKQFHQSGEVPPTKTGGILTVSIELKQRGASALYPPSRRESEVHGKPQREARGISAGGSQRLVSGGVADMASGRVAFRKASAVRFSDSQRPAGGCRIPRLGPFRASVVAFRARVLRDRPEQLEIRSKGYIAHPHWAVTLQIGYRCAICAASSRRTRPIQTNIAQIHGKKPNHLMSLVLVVCSSMSADPRNSTAIWPPIFGRKLEFRRRRYVGFHITAFAGDSL